MTNPSRVYWDSSVWIALIKGEVVEGVDRCEVPRLILEDARDGKVEIFISRLTIVEVHKKRNSQDLTKTEDDKIQKDFFSHQYIKQIDVDKKIVYSARDYAWQFNMRPNDAIHLASAIRVNAEVIHHWDQDFYKVPKTLILSENPLKWTKQTTIPL